MTSSVRPLKRPWTCVIISSDASEYERANLWCEQNVPAAGSTIRGRSWLCDGFTHVWFADPLVAKEFEIWLKLSSS